MVHDLPSGRIHEGDWLQADLESGYSLAIVDGPYGMGKGGWDRVKIDALAEWYAPHVDLLSALCAKAATVYLWNTAEGWARIDPVMRAAGWTFCVLVTWEKTNSPSMKGHEALLAWPDVTEVCGMYRREAWALSGGAGQEIGYAAGADDRNWIRPWLCDEWVGAGLRRGQADEALGTNGMAGHYFGASQWSLPTWANYQKLADYANQHGAKRDRPWLVLDRFWPTGGLRASYDHLRAEYEASRPVFNCPAGVSNVWAAPLVASPERLVGANGQPLHPCQKPLAFAERMIRASSRPGERILAPFGGTCREAVICEWLARTTPAEARRYDVCELNQDGPDYIGAALAQIRGEDTRKANPAQVALFGSSK